MNIEPSFQSSTLPLTPPSRLDQGLVNTAISVLIGQMKLKQQAGENYSFKQVLYNIFPV